jgi:hypothetical protein
MVALCRAITQITHIQCTYSSSSVCAGTFSCPWFLAHVLPLEVVQGALLEAGRGCRAGRVA